MSRVGFGYDVHAFGDNLPLVLGGVNIPFPKGLQGHSDADVLTHALIDALLGAAALGDIGTHFPDTDPEYRNISSLILLATTWEKLAARGFDIINVDSTVVLQEPEIAHFIPEMRQNIANALQIDLSQVSVKATTTERLGFAGRGEGVAAYAVAMVSPV